MSVIELASSLPPDECAARLRAAIDQEGVLSATGLFGSKPVAGRIAGHRVRLRKRIWYRNSFQTFMIGSLEGRDGSTIFRGKAGMHPFVTGFMAVWFGLLTLIVGAAFVAGIGALFGGRGDPLGVIALPVGLAFGGGFVWFGRWLARNEEAFLVGFVAEVIAAGHAPDAEADGGGTMTSPGS